MPRCCFQKVLCSSSFSASPLRLRVEASAMSKARDKDDGKLGLWESILSEVAHAARVPDSTLLCLGRPGVGKRTLIRAVQAHAWPTAAAAAAAEEEGHSRAVALDYSYFAVRDPEMDEAAATQDFVCPAAVSVLILEDVAHEKLLKSRLMNRGGLKNCAAMICLDLKEPWTIMEDLRMWLATLQRIASELMQDLTVGEQDELRNKVAKAVEEYREPNDSPEKPDRPSKVPMEDPLADDSVPALDSTPSDAAKSKLMYNLGIPLIVAVLRSDGSSVLDSQKTVGWAEIIEASLRTECLPFGASIMYTMVQGKNNRNVEAMYDYLVYRLYGYPFRHKPVAPSRDALLIPSGWDDNDKLDKAALERSFESVVVSPSPPAPAPPPPEFCEDMQTFLSNQAVVLQKLGGAGGATVMKSARAAPIGPPSASGAGEERKQSSRPIPLTRPSAATAAATDNTSLQNFFQTLLTRGSQAQAAGAKAPSVGSGGAGVGAPGTTGVPAEAAAAAAPAAVRASTAMPKATSTETPVPTPPAPADTAQ